MPQVEARKKGGGGEARRRLRCDACGIEVNSLAQLEAHNAGAKHRAAAAATKGKKATAK